MEWSKLGHGWNRCSLSRSSEEIETKNSKLNLKRMVVLAVNNSIFLVLSARKVKCRRKFFILFFLKNFSLGKVTKEKERKYGDVFALDGHKTNHG
jgi:hypothetical protein